MIRPNALHYTTDEYRNEVGKRIKSCLKCGYGGGLIRLSSIDKLLCPECHHYNDWVLKPNQKSVLIEGKVGDV